MRRSISFKILSSFACLFYYLCTCDLAYADYSSLTPREREIVVEAFEKAKFYKYYLALVEGQDKIVFRNIRKLSEKPLDANTVEHTYSVEADLIVAGTTFQRVGEIVTVLEVEQDSWWNWQTAGKILIGIIAGFVGGYAVGSR